MSLEEPAHTDGGKFYADLPVQSLAPGLYFLTCRVEDAKGVRTLRKRIAIAR